MPHAGHFIGGNECRFHLNTYVNGYIVSTVGEYRPRGEAGPEVPLGPGRTYETMVFPARERTDEARGCCPYTAADWSELEAEGYNDAEAARLGHLRLVEKYGEL